MQQIDIAKFLKNIFIILLGFLLILMLYFSHIMAGVLVPIFFAFFTAMFLHPFIHRLHETRVPNWLSTIIVYLLFIMIVAMFLTAAIVVGIYKSEFGLLNWDWEIALLFGIVISATDKSCILKVILMVGSV